MTLSLLAEIGTSKYLIGKIPIWQLKIQAYIHLVYFIVTYNSQYLPFVKINFQS
jgi:hypothetical protein